MPTFSVGTVLFYGGIIGMTIAAAGAIVAIILFAASGRHLKRRLEEEYGKKNV